MRLAPIFMSSKYPRASSSLGKWKHSAGETAFSVAQLRRPSARRISSGASLNALESTETTYLYGMPWSVRYGLGGLAGKTATHIVDCEMGSERTGHCSVLIQKHNILVQTANSPTLCCRGYRLNPRSDTWSCWNRSLGPLTRLLIARLEMKCVTVPAPDMR